MIRGVYDDEPTQSVALFLDFKDAPSPELWEALCQAVQPLADRGYLTFWTADGTHGKEMESDTLSSGITIWPLPSRAPGRYTPVLSR